MRTSCSTESKAFVEAVDRKGCSAAEKYALLQRAASAQSGYARAASQGQGVDRHMLGLKLCVQEGEAMPGIFADPKYGGRRDVMIYLEMIHKYECPFCTLVVSTPLLTQAALTDKTCQLYSSPPLSSKRYGESSHWRLSTSSLASEYFVTWGFGEVVADGYGVAYMVKKNELAVTVTSRHLGAKAFADEIERALHDMRAMCQEATGGAGKAKL